MRFLANAIFHWTVGRYKTQVVNACRSAIKSNNVSSLFKIIKTAATWLDDSQAPKTSNIIIVPSGCTLLHLPCLCLDKDRSQYRDYLLVCLSYWNVLNVFIMLLLLYINCESNICVVFLVGFTPIHVMQRFRYSGDTKCKHHGTNNAKD